MQGLVLENLQIVPGQVAGPADLNSAAVTGDYVNMQNYEKCLILLFCGDGSATTGDLTVALYQATDVGGSGAKVLNALETGRIFTKQAASSFAAVGQWTAETQATADEQYTDATSGEQVNLWAFEIRAADLDVDGGFSCIRADVAATSSSKIGALLYILAEPKNAAAPALMPSAIA